MTFQVNVSISFPCTDVEWATLCRMRNLVGNVRVSAPITGEKALVAGELTEKENHLLEVMSQKTHANGSTPLMDLLDDKQFTTPVSSGLQRKRGGGQPKDPNSIASLMIQCLTEKNGKATHAELVDYIMPLRPDFARRQIVSGLYACRSKQGVGTDAEGMWVHPSLGEVHV